MAESDALRASIEGLLARAAAGEHGLSFVRRIEDVLAQGYAQALRLDARRRRLDAEVEELAKAPADAEAVQRLRTLALEARRHDAGARELRALLGILRRRFVALGGTRVTH